MESVALHDGISDSKRNRDHRNGEEYTVYTQGERNVRNAGEPATADGKMKNLESKDRRDAGPDVSSCDENKRDFTR